MRKALVCLLLALACTANAETITGLVVGIADGDTITVLDADKVQHKIRLAGIDAPEKKQPFGNRSKESLSALAFDKTVNVETSKRDRYGRQIGKVLVNGRDVNLVQVERGMAWFYRRAIHLAPQLTLHRLANRCHGNGLAWPTNAPRWKT